MLGLRTQSTCCSTKRATRLPITEVRKHGWPQDTVNEARKGVLQSQTDTTARASAPVAFGLLGSLRIAHLSALAGCWPSANLVLLQHAYSF